MPDLLQFLILFGVGTIAGIINVMAGGGSALTLPTLIFLGLDSATANGTNRVAILFNGLFAALAFKKEKVSRLRQSITLAAFTLPGAIIGAIVAVRISDVWFQRILGIIMIGVVLSMLFSRYDSDEATTTLEGTRSWLVYPALFGIGFYGGFIQVGVGFLIMAALYHLLKMNLVYVNMHKAVIVLLYTVPALLIFAWLGYIDWWLGLSLAAGNAFGGWWAAIWAVRKGEKVIRYVLIVAILIMAAKLLGLF
jgi:uncharacterized membrane protein YfcA